jgi:hypothetical protein
MSLIPMKLGIVGIAVVGVFLLAALGKLPAEAAEAGVVTLVTGLTLALGIAQNGREQGGDTTVTTKKIVEMVSPPTSVEVSKTPAMFPLDQDNSSSSKKVGPT